jgi:phosphoenolpyruvate carboxylase
MEPKVLDHNAPLKNDIKKLGSILGEILVYQGGTELLNKVESIRKMTIDLRGNYDEGVYQKLKEEISNLNPPIRKQVIRAFSIYFHLVNIAEQNHRIRRRREYQLQDDGMIQPLSIESVVSYIKENNVPNELIEDVLHHLSLELVFTAHPTEATKRSVLEIQKRISAILRQLENPLLTKKEKDNLDESFYNEIMVLWQTDELRSHKPTVMAEVRNGLYYFDTTLFDILPEIHQELEDQLEDYFPMKKWEVPNFLRFGSWIGGDRDGNPNVTPDVTWETLEKHRKLVLKKYGEIIVELMKRLSHSINGVKVSEALIDSVEKEEQLYLSDRRTWPIETEVYRRKFAIILERLRNVGNELGYSKSEELLQDLLLIKESVELHHPSHHRLKMLRKLIRQVELFGFHLASLDIRNHSGEHQFAIDEMLRKVNLSNNYAELKEQDKVAILKNILSDPRPITLISDDYSKETQDILKVFKTIRNAHEEFGKKSIVVYLVSMTRSVSDLLEVLVLAKEAGIYRLHANGQVESDLHVAPLLETVDDLIAGPEIMETLFEMKAYRNHLSERGNLQEIMLGYSDGSKDGGTLTANWKLYEAQQKIHDIAKKYNIRLKFFHGRGGSLGRGGGPLNNSILSQPNETLGDGVKITEQGEVLSSRYLLPEIAYRSLEQAISTLMKAAVSASTNSNENLVKEDIWKAAMEEISTSAIRKYKSLVFEDKDFLTYFTEATPLKELGSLNIGSRPMSRKNSKRFEDLRAIPWVFAWTQCRQLLPAWYAAGTGLNSFIKKSEGNLELLKEMYKSWPFFRSTINNLQMAIIKADMASAEEYIKLVEDKNIAERIFKNIKEEYELTRTILLTISGNQELLDHTPNIKESIRRRNPYVDPLNFLQVELINKLRQEDRITEELLTEVLLTIGGIAAGLRNTG